MLKPSSPAPTSFVPRTLVWLTLAVGIVDLAVLNLVAAPMVFGHQPAPRPLTPPVPASSTLSVPNADVVHAEVAVPTAGRTVVRASSVSADPGAAATEVDATHAPQAEGRRVGATVSFASNGIDIERSGRRALWPLSRTAARDATWRVVVVGHADWRGSERYNRRLSLARARAVARFFARRGVAGSRIEVRALGEVHAQPAVFTAAALEQDRRVDVWLVPADAPFAVEERLGSQP